MAVTNHSENGGNPTANTVSRPFPQTYRKPAANLPQTLSRYPYRGNRAPAYARGTLTWGCLSHPNTTEA